jgi:hypothetical protein
MIVKTLLLCSLTMATAIPILADGKKKNLPERAMLETMESVPCGAKQNGLTGLGSVWASAGITHVNSDEKLCPQYLVRTDQMEYHIRPMDNKHPVILPVGHEIEFKIKKDRMFVRIPDGDKKMRNYKVVAMKPANSDNQTGTPSANNSKP